MYVCMHASVCMYVHMCLSMCVCVCVRVYLVLPLAGHDLSIDATDWDLNKQYQYWQRKQKNVSLKKRS